MTRVNCESGRKTTEIHANNPKGRDRHYLSANPKEDLYEAIRAVERFIRTGSSEDMRLANEMRDVFVRKLRELCRSVSAGELGAIPPQEVMTIVVENDNTKQMQILKTTKAIFEHVKGVPAMASREKNKQAEYADTAAAHGKYFYGDKKGDRRREVVRLYNSGMKEKEIANRLHVSIRTVQGDLTMIRSIAKQEGIQNPIVEHKKQRPDLIPAYNSPILPKN